MTRIAGVQVYRADLPLSVPLSHASASEAALEEVFLRVQTTSGGWGLAEVRGNGSYATGAGTATVVRELALGARNAMLGVPLAEASALIAQVYDTPLVQALADAAVHDAIAREAGRPLWQALGGQCIESIPTHAQIGFRALEQAVELARSVAGSGLGRIKLRVGRPNPEDDIELVRAVRGAVGADMALAVDANGGWDLPTAVQVLEGIEASGIAWAEQPTPPGNEEALRAVRQATGIPIVADEAVKTAGDMARLCSADAIDGVHLKLEKAGTIAALRNLAAQARNAGLRVYLGQMDQGRLGSSVTAHLAASIEAEAYEVWGFQQVVHDVATGFELHGGRALLPTGPGTGVDVKLNELELVKELT